MRGGMRMARKANHCEGVRSTIMKVLPSCTCTHCEHYHESLITDDVTANHIAIILPRQRSTKFVSELEAEIKNTQVVPEIAAEQRTCKSADCCGHSEKHGDF
jgi:hypothetical protein